MPGKTDCYKGSKNFSRVVDVDKYSSAHWSVTCPAIYDGFACWSKTPAGALAYQNCPASIVDFDANRLVHKRCSENGTWLTDLMSVSNYTTCLDGENAVIRGILTYLYVIEYNISSIALVIALFIYCRFKSLSCRRVTVHKHLFVSFLCNNISRIIWYTTIANNYAVMERNEIWCQIVHLLTNTFLVTTYSWMLCQGLVLYQAVNSLYMDDHISTFKLSICGWVIPFLYIGIYTAARKFAGDTERCWSDRTETIWVMIIPILVCIIVGLGILFYVTHTLTTKERPTSTNQNQRATRKISCATALMIPLFGLHYILVPIQPGYRSGFAMTYHVCSAVLTPLQGLFVSIIFCFMNYEVRNVIRTRIEHALRRRSNNIAMQAIPPATPQPIEIT